jgi:hypothetical protein
MKDAYYFVYETTNLTRKEKELKPFIYVGQHCTKDLSDGYFGSCKELKEDIAKGDKCVREIVQHYNNIYHLGDAEHERIKGLNAVNDPIYYNKRNPLCYNEPFEYGLSEEQKRKMSKSLKGIVAWNKGLKNCYSKEVIKKWSEDRKGYKHTEESKRKMSEAGKNKPNSKEHNMNISKGLKGRVPWNKGKKLSEEIKKNMSEAQKGNKNGHGKKGRIYKKWGKI